MSFGSNTPFGFLPVGHTNGSNWNGEMQSLPIASGLRQNICRGDIVYTMLQSEVALMIDPTITTSPAVAAGIFTANASTFGIRTIRSAGNAGINPAGIGADFTPATMLRPIGVFWGCKYTTTIGSQPQSITSKTWVSGTRTVDDSPVEALVITDPSVVYKGQVSTSSYLAANIISASQFAFGQNFYVGVGTSGTGDETGTVAGVAIPNNVYATDGSLLLPNPQGANLKEGVSAQFIDISGANRGAAGYGASAARAPLRFYEFSNQIGTSTNSVWNQNDLSQNYFNFRVAPATPAINAAVNPQRVSNNMAFNVIHVTLNTNFVSAANA